MDSVAQLRKKPRLTIVPSNVSDHPALLLDRKPRFPAALDNLAFDREFISTGVGSKTKACLKFFSTSGCPYGESCHFSHYVPGGLASVTFSQPTSHVMDSGFLKTHHSSSQVAMLDSHKSQLCKNFGTVEGCRFGDKCLFLHSHPEKETRKSNGSSYISDRGSDGFSSILSPVSQGPIEGYKTRLCKNFQSADGCRFGEKCHFAHGEAELRKSNGSAGSLSEQTPSGSGAAASFGSVSTAKISIDASLAGLIIGKGGVNAKAICRVTGAKLFVKDHESDSSLRNIEMEGSLDQIQRASAMVRELLVHMDVAPSKPGGAGTPNYKTKICENYAKGSCTYGDRCHFAHGSDELRTTVSDC